MEKLTAKLGKPPFQLAQFYLLRRDWTSIMRDLTFDNHFDQGKVVEMIEIMEALASTMQFDVYLTFPELKNEENQASNGLPWGNWVALLRRDLHNDLSSLLRDIMHLKRLLFEALQLQEICKPAADSTAVCQYCNWILARCGRGLDELADPDKISDDYSHLCAIDRFPNFEQLKAGSIKGCQFCDFLRSALLKPDAIDYQYCNYRGVTDLSTEPFYIWVKWRWKRASTSTDIALRTLSCLTVKIWSFTVLFGQNEWDFCVESDDATLTSKLGIYRPPQLNVLSPPNIAFIQKQLDQRKIDVHPENMSENFLPRRLVDLGINGNSSPRVVNSVDLDDTCRYATLSYCWGTPTEAKQQLKLTCENRDQFYTKLPLESIPPLLNNTFSVCRALDIRHIWIDALCILQGDKTDWEEQSSQMHMIFQRSFVTLCTPASSSCTQGFLDRASKTWGPRVRLCYVDESSKEVLGTYSLRPMLRTGREELSGVPPHVFPMLTAEQRDMTLSTWAHRGWIFQERFMSSLQIMFGTTMLHVRGEEVVMSENGESTKQETDLFHLKRESGTNSSLSNRRRHLADHWYKIIEGYAGMKWTERLDLFPGVSGVAALFQEAMNDKYLAGLWQTDLHCGLLWHAQAKLGSLSSLGELLTILNGNEMRIGPSWSWASRPEFFQFDISPHVNTLCHIRSHLRPEFKLLSSSIFVDGVNPLGRLEKASLKLSACVIRLRAGRLPNFQAPYTRWRYTTSKGHTLSIGTDWDPWRQQEGNEQGVHLVHDGQLQLLIISSCCSDVSGPVYKCSTFEPSEDETEDHFDQVTYKPGYRYTYFKDKDEGLDAVSDCPLCSEHDRRRDVWGLLLHTMDDASAFQRVGTFICRAEYGGSALLEEAEIQTLDLC